VVRAVILTGGEGEELYLVGGEVEKLRLVSR
jgi:hypothetical protein